jgi:HEAT repeat protein
MARKEGEALLTRVRQAREEAGTEASLRTLREALKSRESRAVAKAAAVAAEQDLTVLRPELDAALRRLLDEGHTADPGCAAKGALCEALDRLGHDDRELFRQAIRHVQWEPVWGGRVDTAVELRGAAAMALARLDPQGALIDLARLLGDPQPPARMAAARALAYRGGTDSLALLHLRIHTGDPAPPVMGASFEAALRVSPASSVALVAGFLDSASTEVCEEAALALGASRLPEAFPPLREWCGRVVDAGRRRMGLRAMALLRREESLAFLLERVREGSSRAAAEAIEALADLRGDERLVARVREAAAQREESQVRAALREVFG